MGDATRVSWLGLDEVLEQSTEKSQQAYQRPSVLENPLKDWSSISKFLTFMRNGNSSGQRKPTKRRIRKVMMAGWMKNAKFMILYIGVSGIGYNAICIEIFDALVNPVEIYCPPVLRNACRIILYIRPLVNTKTFLRLCSGGYACSEHETFLRLCSRWGCICIAGCCCRHWKINPLYWTSPWGSIKPFYLSLESLYSILIIEANLFVTWFMYWLVN